MKTPFSTVLLDADGTLLDFDEAERQGVREVLKKQGVEPAAELENRYHDINLKYWKLFETGVIEKAEIFRGRYKEFFETLGMQVDVEAVERQYREVLDSCSALIPDALEVCTYLKGRYTLYIVTNGVASTQYRRLKDSGLEPYFENVFVSETVGSQKPQKAYFDYCLDRIGERDLSRILIVGDSLSSDIQGGKNAGIKTCWVNLDGKELEETIHPDYEVRTLRELKEIL